MFVVANRQQLSEPARDCLRGLLERRVASRLGSGSNGAEEVKRCAFFSALDWAKVLGKEYTPEFRPPAASSESDVRNFDAEFTNENAADSMVTTHMTETMEEKSKFEGFTYQGDDNAHLK
jgi:hypothetical protein